MTRFPAAADRWVVLGAAAWALSVVFFVGQAIAQAAQAAPYSLMTSTISDLGNTACGPFSTGTYHATICSPAHSVMNGTFVVTGLLYIAGAILTWRAWPRRRLVTWGLVIVALAGAGQALVGFSPENVALVRHSIGALFGIPGGDLGVLLLGLALLRPARPLGAVAVAMGAIGLLAFVLFVVAPGLPIGFVERLAVYPGALGIVLLGAALLLRTAPARPTAPA